MPWVGWKPIEPLLLWISTQTVFLDQLMLTSGLLQRYGVPTFFRLYPIADSANPEIQIAGVRAPLLLPPSALGAPHSQALGALSLHVLVPSSRLLTSSTKAASPCRTHRCT